MKHLILIFLLSFMSFQASARIETKNFKLEKFKVVKVASKMVLVSKGNQRYTVSRKMFGRKTPKTNSYFYTTMKNVKIAKKS